MAAKRVDPLKAKAAKQKKIAIGLCVMFVLVLAYQGPKTLKLLKGPQPAAVALLDQHATSSHGPVRGFDAPRPFARSRALACSAGR